MSHGLARRPGTRTLLLGALALLLAPYLSGCGADQAPAPPPEVATRERDLPTPTKAAPPVEDVPDSVSVFYATDRARFTPDALWYVKRFVPAALTLLLGLGLAHRLRRMLRPEYARWAGATRLLVYLGAAALAADAGVRSLRMAQRTQRLTLQYGDGRLETPPADGLPLELGLAQVSIPPSHVLGEVERPSVWRGDLFEDPREHMVVHGLTAWAEAPWFAALKEVVEGSDALDAFVFVHGYNVTFEEALLRTAQIAYDLKFRGAPICFSWPSCGGLAEYTVDEANVRWATAHLERFLVALRERSGAQRIHLIAHSMGNRALTEALQRLRAKAPDAPPPFHEIVLAAPDLDAATFRDDLAPAILPAGRRVTLYASSRDAALAASRKVHGYPRAGEAGEGLVVVPGLETVDVSEVSGSHSYIGNSGRVLDDLGAILLRQAKRAERPGAVLSRLLRGLPYWLLQAGGG